MGWKSAIAGIFGGGDFVGSLERVALEAIQTDTEKAEAKSLYAKVLDPNGKMRRDTMKFVCMVYGFYLVNAVVLIYIGVFGESADAGKALEAITNTFTPVTGVFGLLASASFGVNASNNWKEANINGK